VVEEPSIFSLQLSKLNSATFPKLTNLSYLTDLKLTNSNNMSLELTQN